MLMLMWRLSANLMSNGTKKSSGRLLKNTCSTNWKHHPHPLLAYTFGPRTDETCRELLALLTPFKHRHDHQRRLGQAMAGRCRRISI
ncbi:Transposase [Shigella dysenteriae 1617]|uniref:Transposase n=1 Tax=Shigella dysenteriae 1617 TaxID=754093 RepID=A0A0A6ZM44_SHIDY|nr:Transposase [Shigella dysenteriae 1617]